MREEWIKCVRHTHADMKMMSWCGRRLENSEFAFVNIDHAAYNGLHKGRLVACSACFLEIVKHLGNGIAR